MKKKNHLFCTSQGLKLFICKSVHRDSTVHARARGCTFVCVSLCLLTGKREAVLITTNPHTLLTASERTSLTAPPMISLISCLLSPPFIFLLFIYLRFVHTYCPGSTSFEGFTKSTLGRGVFPSCLYFAWRKKKRCFTVTHAFPRFFLFLKDGEASLKVTSVAD